MVINPYADQIDLPAGTPTSVINTILNIRAQAQAAAQRQAYINQQNDPWATGINSLLNNVVTPYIQKQFIDLPYQEDLYSYKSNQDLQREQALLNSRDMSAQNQAIFKRAQDYSGLTDFGNAIGDYTNAIQPQTTLENYSFQNPMGPQGTYNDQYIDYPGNPSVPTYVQKPPTNIQGDLASTGQTPLETTTTESKTTQPSTADAFRLIAGQNPLNAGILAQAFERNANLANLLDPLKQREREAAMAAKEAQSTATLGKAQDIQSTLEARLRALGAQAGANETRGLLYGQQAVTAEQRNDMVRKMLDPNTTKEEFDKLLSTYSGKFAPQANTGFSKAINLQIAIANEQDPARRKLLEDAYQRDRADQVALTGQRAAASAAATAPYAMAKTEEGKWANLETGLATFNQDQQTLAEAVARFSETGLMPKNPSMLSEAKARLTRANPANWTPEAQQDYQVILSLTPELISTYDRNIRGMIGAPRIRESMNLPTDPTLVSLDRFQGLFDAWDKGKEALTTHINKRREGLPSIRPGTPGFGAPKGFNPVGQ